MTYTDIKYLCTIEVEGEEAASFLQSQLTADIDALDIGDSTFACYCTPRGQVIALLLVCRMEDRFCLVCASSLAEAVLKRLRLYVMRAKATFSQPENVNVCGSAAGDSPMATFQPGGIPLRFGFNEGGFSGALNDWKALELSAGICWLGPQSSEQFIPQMLGFEALGALSFSKGCYPGQEIVARARYLGKVKRGVRKLQLESVIDLDVMDKVRLERESEWSAGKVIDSVQASDGTTRLLVQCTNEPDSEVTAIEVDGKRYRCATI